MKLKIIIFFTFAWFTLIGFAQTEEDIINSSSKAVSINSQFVKSFIGLNLDSLNSLPKGSFHIEISEASNDDIIEFNGVQYKTHVNIICDKYNPKLVSLNDIKNIYRHEYLYDEYCLFIINDILITKDLNSFKIDEEYIHSIDLIKYREIETFDGENLDLSIIRIYTKTKQLLDAERSLYKLKPQ